MKSQILISEPRRLLHVIQGWPPPGPNYFRWDTGKLVYFTGSADRSIVPDPDEWAPFWRLCDDVNVWSWPRWIGDRTVVDGLQFTIEIEVGSRSVTAAGQAAGTPGSLEEDLLRLHRALQWIVGWNGLE